MKISTTTGLVGFLLALSALNMPQAEANTYNSSQSTIEQRLARISAVIRDQANNIPESAKTDTESRNLLAGAWGNGRGRGWVNARRTGGWGNGGGRGWINGNPWRDGGSFWNRRW